MARRGALALQTSMTLDMEPIKYRNLIKGMTPMTKTPVSTAFDMVRNEEMLKNICFISTLLNKAADVPEIFTINGITIYGKEVIGVKNDLFKGAWTNISAYLKRPKDKFGAMTITGSNELMALVVRSVLCMAYDDNPNWLNSRAQAFVVGFYAKSMTYIVSRLFSFDVEESAISSYAFACYYASKFDQRRDKNNIPELLNRCTDVFNNGRVSKADLDKHMSNIIGKDDITMDHVIEFIRKLGPNRVANLSAGNIYQALLSSSRSNVPTVIAADYPPYMVYMLLRTVSNDKHPIFTNIINNRYTRPQINAELDNIVRDKNTYQGIVING